MVQIPKSHRKKDYPSYFRSRRNRLWLGVSLRLNRGRPDINSPGFVYYPLGAPLAKTGNLVSLNAPFEMDNNRTNIVSPSSSSWNDWLIQELVALTTRLLTADWYERFGVGAYLALEARERNPSNYLAESYADSIVDHLSKEKAWASRRRNRGRVTFVTADTLALPNRTELDGFLDNKAYLDANLATNDVVATLSSDCGAKRFGPDSLVRLRCAGEDASRLKTRPHGSGATGTSQTSTDRFANSLFRSSLPKPSTRLDSWTVTRLTCSTRLRPWQLTDACTLSLNPCMKCLQMRGGLPRPAEPAPPP